MNDFIQKNIHLLTINHLKTFAEKNRIPYTEKEINIVYDCIKNHYQELLNHNQKPLKNIQSKISPTLYDQLLNLYQKYL